jgi:hypothetical protein
MGSYWATYCTVCRKPLDAPVQIGRGEALIHAGCLDRAPGWREAKATALIDRLEGVLKEQEGAGHWEFGSRCSWCEGEIFPRETADGHRPSCELSQALAAVKEWREGK